VLRLTLAVKGCVSEGLNHVTAASLKSAASLRNHWQSIHVVASSYMLTGALNVVLQWQQQLKFTMCSTYYLPGEKFISRASRS
jgi:hypothetical protein